jgi:uncharacterized membrane protein
MGTDSRDELEEPPSGRNETPTEKLDRNWYELLQEVRVMQTGIQILAGFLLTLPFQQKFAELDSVQITVYLGLVFVSASITALLLTAVNMHRVFFRRHIRVALVDNSDRIIRGAMLFAGLILIGTTWLIFDMVLGRAAATITAAVLVLLLVLMWVVLPLAIRRKYADHSGRGTEPPAGR